ncbi:hypothetical protein IVB46_30185 [Bradyrhizobium sp. 61]|uniref:hypothetical protein n=1 Tax=unclassified Bradyrhizobium TaxID=2631580 RepID=UPI001FFC0B50|nr:MULTISPECIES: hypothetical protein [unclassified Bradyrhizobium]MCK1279498.1 hypothetical protein [Bradyrhizobium sp. 61]MCK1445896.1 hypothetical protein [Bradyrhizobium sp. 48]MCK1461006.1 hypothetical protein [Bradyrhizobium sp. 2]
MAQTGDEQAEWLAVIGKSLAYLCLKQAEKDDPDKMAGILAKVKFLKGLGLSQDAAAEAVGSSAKSVSVMAGRKAKNGRKGRGTKKKARR